MAKNIVDSEYPELAALHQGSSPAQSTQELPSATRASRRQASKRRRKRRALGVSVTVGALALGSVGVANAHRTITLDVDGEVRTVSTFRRSVAALLEREGVILDQHDVVTPAAEAALVHGAEVVVRYGREIEVKVDGQTDAEWVAALDATDALNALRERGRDVRLVASRSAGRPEVPIRMASPGDRIAIVTAQGTETVEYQGFALDETLAQAGEQIVEADIVTLVAPEDAGVNPELDAELAVIVQRVRSRDVAEREAIDYQTIETTDENRFEDLPPVVEQTGSPGELTRIYRVTTVDDEEVEREFLSESVTVEPVDHIVSIGTRERPPALQTGGFSESVWQALAQCESSGNPRAVSAGGRFHGLYQFSVATWQSMGGTGLPSQASPAEQRARAVALQGPVGLGAMARLLGQIRVAVG